VNWFTLNALKGVTFRLLLLLIFLAAFPFTSYADFGQINGQYDSFSDFAPSPTYSKKLALLSAAVSNDVYQNNSYGFNLQNAGFSNVNFIDIGYDVQAVTAIKEFPAEGKRIIAISFRGTASLDDAMTDLNVAGDVFNPADPTIEVHHGFMQSTRYFMAYEPNILIDGVKTLDAIIAENNPDDVFWISGHSLGGAIATLYSAKLKDRGINPANIVTYTFGAPAVGNNHFAAVFDNQINLHRVRNLYDPVPYSTYIATLNPFDTYQQIGYQTVYDNKVDVTSFFVTPWLTDLNVSDHFLAVYEANLGWVNNSSIAQATALADAISAKDMIASGENKYYTFTLDAPSNVTVTGNRQSGVGDVNVTWSASVYDASNHSQLDFSFYSTTGTARQVGLPAGSYYIKVYTNAGSLYGVPYNITANVSNGTTFEQEPNDSTSTATPLTVNTQYTGNIQGYSDVDYYKFTLDAPSNVTVIGNRQSGTGDVNVAWSASVYDASNHSQLDFSFYSTTGTAKQVGLPAGSYYIKIYTSAGPLYGVPYNITANVSNGTTFEQEPNDSTSTATPLTVNMQYTGNIQGYSDVDYYKFTLDAPSNVTVIGSRQNGTEDVNVTWSASVYDASNHSQLDFSFYSTTGTARQVGLPAGSYYIKIYTSAGPLYGVPYNITANVSNGTTFEQEPNDSTSTATPLAVNMQYTGNIQGYSDVDYYKFTLDAPSNVTVIGSRQNGTGDVNVAWSASVYDASNHRQLDFSFYSTTGTARQVGLPAGSYYIKIYTSAGPLYGVPYNITANVSIGTTFEQEPNDSTSTATPLTVNTQYTGNIQGYSDVDYYKFTLDAPSNVTVIGSRQSGTGDVNVTWSASVYDASTHSQLDFSFYSTTGTAKQVGLPAGSYYIKIYTSAGPLYGVPYNITANVSNGTTFEQEPNDSTSTATPLTVNTQYTGNIQGYSDVDYYKFTLDAPSNVTVIGSRQNGTGDVNVTWSASVYDASTHSQLDFSFYSTTGTARQIGLPAGSYYIKIYTSAGPLYGVPYNITANVSNGTTFEQEPNDSTSTATPITVNTQYTGNIQGYSDIDYYKFTLDAPSNVTIIGSLQSGTGNVNVTWSASVYDASNNCQLNFSFYSTTGTARQVGLPAGSYYIKIQTSAGFLYGVPYNITANVTNGSTFEQEPNESTSTATPLTLNTQYTGNIQEYSDVDYYKFTLDAPSNVTIIGSLQSGTGNVNVTWSLNVYDASTNPLLNFSFYSSAGISRQVDLQAGIYYIKISTSASFLYGIPYNISVTTDTIPPILTTLSMPSTSTNLSVPVVLTATDNVAVTGYLISESQNTPSSSRSNWSASAPSSYVFATEGSKTLYGWVKDAQGNVSASKSASVTIDVTKPTITGLAVLPTVNSLTVSIQNLTATDNVGVAAYLITENSRSPGDSDSGWNSTKPSSYTFSTQGSKTLYAWARDAAGNISSSVSATVIITQNDARAGDCDNDGQVNIAEVQSAINMFLGIKTPQNCVDTNGDGAVSIAEVQKTINGFLGI
jgi:pimeloyl-ACP methyl ester carboxylesterase